MVAVEFRTSSAFRGWVRVLGHGFGVRAKKIKSRDCALASYLLRLKSPHDRPADLVVPMKREVL